MPKDWFQCTINAQVKITQETLGDKGGEIKHMRGNRLNTLWGISNMGECRTLVKLMGCNHGADEPQNNKHFMQEKLKMTRVQTDNTTRETLKWNWLTSDIGAKQDSKQNYIPIYFIIYQSQATCDHLFALEVWQGWKNQLKKPMWWFIRETQDHPKQ